MRKFKAFFVLVVLIISVFSNVLWAAHPSHAKSTEAFELSQTLSQLLEIHKKRITLEFLADKRSREFFNDLIKDFPVQIRANFRANIIGQFRKVLISNFEAKIAEACKDLFLFLKSNPDLEKSCVNSIAQAKYPMNLAFLALTKQILDHKSFQASQILGSTGNSSIKQDLTSIRELFDRLTVDKTKDPYFSVKEMYAETSRKDFPIWWYDDSQCEVGYTTHGENPEAQEPQRKKQWTVLVFLNADNDLEGAGLKDINEMELVGSDENINIVAQVDRLKDGKGNDISNENWTGTRRYYILRDRTKTIKSKMVMNLDERDMGSKKELADFLCWGVENYPANHFMVVIWNHGAGWKGISYDDQSGKNLFIPDILWAFNQAKPSLAKVNPKHPKFDVLDFDACLMGMLEVAYELREAVDFLVASEETEPAFGVPYQEALSPLRLNPGMQPKTLAKRMVSAYVKSYAVGGSQTTKKFQGSSITKSAYDLSKVASLAALVNKLSAALLANHDAYTKLLVSSAGSFAKVRRYNDESFVDLHDLVLKLTFMKRLPEEIRDICVEILKNIGYPKLIDRLSKPISIKRRTPGAVIWGYNGWKLPPVEIRPSKSSVYHSRFVRSPLNGPDDNGDYLCNIGPFSMVFDPVQKKKEFVTEINYKIEDRNGKTGTEFTDRTGREYTLVTQFASESPLIAEGHTQGMSNSYGIAIYYPHCLDFKTRYKTLQFAKDTSWDEFLAKVPQFTPNASVLLTGGMVEDPETLFSFLDAFEKLNVPVDILWDPKTFGFRFKEILSNYRKGAVFTDSVSVNSFSQLAPSGDDLGEYLEDGGSLFIAAQSIEQQNTTLGFLEDYFKFSYVEDDHELPKLNFLYKDEKQLTFSLNGADAAQSAKDITIFESSPPAIPIFVTEDGRKAGITISSDSSSGSKYRGFYLGFRFEAIDGAENRAAVIEKALSHFNLPNKSQ